MSSSGATTSEASKAVRTTLTKSRGVDTWSSALIITKHCWVDDDSQVQRRFENMKESSLTNIHAFGSEERNPLDQPAEQAALDNALVQAIATGSQIALSELYYRYRLLMRKVIAQILPDEADVDETLQDVFLGIWNNAAKFDSKKGYLMGWMICIARRRAVDRVRRTRRYTAHTVRLEAICSGSRGGDCHPSGNLTTHHDLLAPHDLREHLLLIIAKLPLEQRQVVQLTYFDDLSQREIVARTGIPLGTVKTRLELARRKLLLNAIHLREEI